MRVTITRHPSGPRLHIGGARIHHGLVGELLAFTGLAVALVILAVGIPIVLLGLACMIHDGRDHPWSTAVLHDDEMTHAEDRADPGHW